MTLIQDFSAGYYIAPEVSIEAFNGENPAIPYDLYEEIGEVVGLPAYGCVGGRRFRLRPECGIPADTLAVPEGDFSQYNDTLLVEKSGEGGRFL